MSATPPEPSRHWAVVSPEMGEMIPITDDGLGPMEYGCEVVSVEAATRREAIVKGVRLMTKWPHWARSESMNPFVGVKAEDPRCEHGVCWCELCGGDKQQCEQCEAAYPEAAE